MQLANLAVDNFIRLHLVRTLVVYGKAVAVVETLPSRFPRGLRPFVGASEFDEHGVLLISDEVVQLELR